MCDVGANRIRSTSIANPIKNQATVLKRVVAFVLFRKIVETFQETSLQRQFYLSVCIRILCTFAVAKW